MSQVLERVSGALLDRYPRLIRAYAHGEAGVYALYKRDRLYYVGLASNLRGRIRGHLIDRHKGRWDLFSLYLVRDRDHVKDLETLLLRIARPRGNKVAGKFTHFEDLKRRVRADVRSELAREQKTLLGLAPRREKRQRRPKGRGRYPRGESGALAPYLDRFLRRRLRATSDGKVFKARVLSDGRISVRRKRFAAPSPAAKYVLGTPRDGWYFWRYERGPDDWRLINELRR